MRPPLLRLKPSFRLKPEATLSICVLCAMLATGTLADAQDWPQFLGPARDGVYKGPPLSETWPAAGPRVAWRKPVGQGFAGPVVAQGRVILFHRVGNEEIVEALDARTGTQQWRYAYATAYRDDFGFDEGPRAMPVVANGVVYTYGAEGHLHALDLAKGTRLWSEDTKKRFATPKGFFGSAGSPLVEDGRVIANVGGRSAGIVAFDAKSGKVLWMATDDEASYSSPVGATIGGKRLAIFLTRAALVGLDPATGQIQFRRPWRARLAASVNAATPLVIGDLIFISAEYGPGAGVLRVDGSNLVDVWHSDEALTNHYATSVQAGGILYGFHGRQEFGQAFRAVELKTGKVRWSEERFGAGSVTLAGDRLLILRESGELVLAAASPDGFRPLTRAPVLPRTVRAFPAIADGFLYARNENTLISLDLRRAAAQAPVESRAILARTRVLPRTLGPGLRRVTAQASADPRATLDRAVAEFERGRIAESVTAFDELVKVAPAIEPQLWQRGIALYYAGRYRDCRRQFELHRTVNPDDVENAAWHFLCVARAESPDRARAALLPVGPDPRVPMRQVYEMFRGKLDPAQVLAAGGSRPDGQFYANLYLGLYYEAVGDARRASEHIKVAAQDRFADAGGYMHMVARIHLSRLK
ncbi:MAG TPA: PQQ-binding-like beta-propeller repeat protein [Vicinamibacterales bacterium]